VRVATAHVPPVGRCSSSTVMGTDAHRSHGGGSPGAAS
jgi:hypothetical protein